MAHVAKPQTRPACGRGLFYSRDSGGHHEQTPGQYVQWAAAEAEKLGVKFRGSKSQIDRLIVSGKPADGDLFFDNSVTGNKLTRPALDALKREIQQDRTVSHIFIPRRDRLARPDHAVDGVVLEKELRGLGVTLVFMKETLVPLRRGQRQNVGEVITACIDYEASGKFRDELAEKMLYAQLQLASRGYTSGGRAPFGFRRNLVREDGVVVRQLADGEIVRQKGHHVVWLPGPDEELDLVRRILTLLETLPATRVAKLLNQEGIPSPDAGRRRKDLGVDHAVSGLWHSTMITNLARSPLVRATTAYGRRSMGDRRRFSTTGPRLVEDADFRSDDKPKVIQNPTSEWVTAAAHFQPIIPTEQADRLTEILDRRAGTQRGKPRSRDPEKNPLGGRVFDMACGWPMYRVPHSGSFRYTCGFYQQSHGGSCAHNHVGGPLLTRFALAAVRQRLLAPEARSRLIAKLQAKLAAKPDAESQRSQQLADLQGKLAEIERQYATAAGNLALASCPETFTAIESKVKGFAAAKSRLLAEIKRLEEQEPVSAAARESVDAAIALLDRLQGLAEDPENLGSIGQLFQLINLQIFLSFQATQKKKRIVNQLTGGVLTIGAAPAPVEKYQGPTGRRALKSRPASGQMNTESAKSEAGEGGEAKWLGNANRDDKTAIELFLNGTRDWDAALRRVCAGKPDSGQLSEGKKDSALYTGSSGPL